MFELIANWQKKRRRLKFLRLMEANLNPIWLFDKGSYVWIMPTRRLRITNDQVGHFIVYDADRMVSGLLFSKEEAQRAALGYIANEILQKYYPKFKLND